MEFKRKLANWKIKKETNLQPLLILIDIIFFFGTESKESNLLTMTLRKIQHPATDRRQRNKRSGTSMPQL